MKAYFINAVTKTITEIRLTKDYRDIQKAIGCDCFTVAGTMRNGDSLYVDDEGLLKEPENFFYAPQFYPSPLAGNGVVLGCDMNDGESRDVQMDIADLEVFWNA